MKNEIKQKAARVRWGNRIGKSKQIRVDECAARALLTVPETDRRRVATQGVMTAVEDYHNSVGSTKSTR